MYSHDRTEGVLSLGASGTRNRQTQDLLVEGRERGERSEQREVTFHLLSLLLKKSQDTEVRWAELKVLRSGRKMPVWDCGPGCVRDGLFSKGS